jgi:uncharacterized protein (DUF305 family)
MKFFLSNIFLAVLFILSDSIVAQNSVGNNDAKSAKKFYKQCMNNMMDNMMQQASTVSVDVDFLQQMIAHHKGAIAMADYEIKHGKNKEMIQLAKSILNEQSAEVKMMNVWLKASSSQSTIPKEYKTTMDVSMNKMMNDIMVDTIADDPDKIFASIMIPHHEAAIDMARAVMLYSSNQQVTAYAKQLISNEQIEVEQMIAFIK